MTMLPRRAHRMRWHRAAALLLCWLGLIGLCRAQEEILSNYHHNAWNAETGAPADIRSMAQTIDGWLFLGTSGGLFRFDGLRFERVAGYLGHLRVQELYAAPTGDLYVSGYNGGVSVLHADGSSALLPGSDGDVLGAISALALDAAGKLWVVGQKIYRFDGARWQAVDADPVWQATSIRSLTLDRDGALWAAYDDGVKRLARGARAFERVDDHGGSLVQAPDGAVWLLPKEGAQIRRLSTPGGAQARADHVNPSGSRFAGLFDRDGALWKLRCPEPVCIAHRAIDPVQGPIFDERLHAAGNLSGLDTRQILEDREGDIWIATQRGLDRFRPSRLRASGLPRNGTGMTVAADAEGQVWAVDGESGALWTLPPDGAPRRVPGPPLTLVVPDHDGGVLLAGHRSIWRQAHGRRTEIPLPPGPDGKPVDRTLMRLIDDGKSIWAAAPDIVLMAWADGKWRSWTTFNLEMKIYLLAPGAPGQLWLGWGGGDLVSFENNKRTHYDAKALGFITGIFAGSEVVVGGDAALGVLVGGHVRVLHAANPDVLRGMSGLVVTPNGDRWLNGAAGIVHVRAEDWRRALAQPQEALRYEVFDAIDGYPGRAVIETAVASAVSGDGRLLWFLGIEGIVALDTRNLYRNAVRPSPMLEGVLTARGALKVPGGLAAPLRIPSDVGRFSVGYTAPSLRMPERVRFEYRLDGFDRDWQEGGARRSADYTNIPPGAYRFRLRAFNEDGVAGTGEATLALRVDPTWTQTLWFRALAALLVLVLITAAYRYRVHYLTARLSERLRVKTGERERIARALHDSFLQSLQSLLMRLDAVAAKLPADAAPRRELETIRDHANDAIVEGRGHVNELRGGDSLALDEVLARAIDLLRPDAGGMQLVLQVEGQRRSLAGDVTEEVGDIAREALRNAVAHAGARTIRVVLGYGRRALTVSVTDDGRGIEEDVARVGARPGHWGLTGMRERAERIGALLAVDSRAGQGTAVRLALPAKRAYLD